MVTSLALAPGEVVLVGGLAMDRKGPHGRPRLLVRAWCPACREHRPVEFHLAPPWPADALAVATMPCPAGCPLAGEETWIGLDPDNRARDAQVLKHFRARLRAWAVERGLADAASGR